LGGEGDPGARSPVRAAGERRLLLHRRHHPGLHDHADRDLVVARGHGDRAADRQRGRVCAGRHPVGDDHRCGLAAQPGRCRRGGAARPGPGHGRDHRGRPGHRFLSGDHVAPVRGRVRHARGHREPVRRGVGRVPGRADRAGRDVVRDHHRHQPDRPRGRGTLRPAQEGGLMAAMEQPGSAMREPSGWRRTKNQVATTLMVLAFVAVLIPLGFVLFTVIAKGASAINWQFLTGGPIPPNVVPAGIGGMGPAVYGTLVITGLAALMAVPLGVLGGIYINEYGGNQVLARVINFFADVMTGVPSIIMGLFIFTIWVLHFGYSGFAGALALACLMLPIVIRSTYEMLRLVPDSLREASYALGATKARVTLTVVLPAAIGGIVSGALLAV